MEKTTKTQTTPAIFKVLGIMAIIGGGMGILSVISLSAWLGLGGGFFLWLILPNLLFGILSIFEGVGFLKLKKWLPWLLIVQMALTILFFAYVSTSAELFAGANLTIWIIGIAVGLVITIYAYTRKAIFIN